MSPARYSLCPLACGPDPCGIELSVRQGRVIRLRGDPQHPISRGGLCTRPFSALSQLFSPHRLRNPLLRAGPRGSGRWKNISWEEALSRLTAAGMARPGAGVLYLGTEAAADPLLTQILAPRWANLCGQTLWNESDLMRADVALGLRLTGYSGGESLPAASERADTALVWGNDPAATCPIALPWLLRIQERGGALIVIDPRVSSTALLADQHLRPQPGTDLVLASALAHEIIAHGWHDAEYIEHYTIGFEAFRHSVEECTPTRAAAITGVPADTISDLARRLSTCGPVLMLPSRAGLGQQREGWQTMRAIASLAGLCGQPGRPGAGLYAESSLRLNPTLTAAGERTWAPLASQHYGEILAALERGYVGSLLLLRGSPLRHWPGLTRVRRALANADLIASWDLTLDPAVEEIADILLPATGWLEQPELRLGMSQVFGLPQVLDPPAECRTAAGLLSDLAERLGVTEYFPWADTMALMDAALASRHCQGLHIDSLFEAPAGLPAPGQSTQPFADGRFETPGGRFTFCSAEADDLGLPALPFSSARLEQLESPSVPAYSLRVLVYHPADPSVEGPTPLLIHPLDASRRGVTDRALAVVFNGQGRARLPVEWSTEVPEGCVALCAGQRELHEVSGAETSVPAAVTLALGTGGAPLVQETTVEVRPA